MTYPRYILLVLLACLFMGVSLSAAAQEVDDLQAYLDELAVEQQEQLSTALPSNPANAPRRTESVEIPIGLPEVDLSRFTSYQNRTTTLVVSVSVKFVNGTIAASSSFTGGGPLVKVANGKSVVLDQTAAVDAGNAPGAGCLAAVGIYGGSTFFQYGNVTAPANGVGIAIYLDGQNDTYCYYAGITKGSIGNEQGGQVIGVDENPAYNNGDTFAALTPEGVTMTFQVISASAKTCRVGNGSNAAIATATAGVITIPQKAKGYTVVKISNRAFIDCSRLTFIGIPATVTTIGETSFGSAVGAFHGCGSITAFEIPSSVTLIGRGTFSGCVGLTELTIPSSVTVLGSNAFDYCIGLKSLTLSPNITDIELETFRNCRSLESLTIPASVRSFGSSAFQGCNSLKTLTSLVQQPFSFGSGVFSNYNVRLYVPVGTKSRYQNTACWNKFYRIYTIGSNEELEDIQEMFAAIGQQLDAIEADQAVIAQQTTVVKTYLNNAELNNMIDTQFSALNAKLATLRTTYEDLRAAVAAADASEYAALRSQVEQLWNDVAELTNAQNAYKQEVATHVGNIIKTELESNVAELTAVQVAINTNVANANMMADQIGTEFFMRQADDDFTAMLNAARTANAADANEAAALVNSFNRMFNGTTISTIEQAVALYESYMALKERLATLKLSVTSHNADVAAAATAFEALSVVFPDQEVAWSIRPAGLQDELQVGYKSNRNFVLTSAGMMWFEQVSGADFRLHDADDNYVVAINGTAALRAGSKDEATVWTGQRVGRGSFVFYNKANGTYLDYNIIGVNRPVTSESSACAWNIIEGIDELQALLNLLAEEQEEEGGGSSLPTDTLVITLPSYDPSTSAPTTPFVFPAVSYPIKVTGGETGYWTIPNPTPGQPRPADFHPIYIPRGSHVIIDDVIFQDIVGGNHAIYVEGTVEINVSVILHITNWEWFIHVAPGGEVIWRATGDMPRINNEGTMSIYAHVDYLLNSGTINHYEGNITQVVNRYHYYFYGGTVTSIYNYGEHHHEGGTALTAHNYAGATFTMNSGYIRNTVVSETDTVFVNQGTFYFYGGIIGGYGSRLVYHGPGATMYINGGHFEFNLVKHYWIEAHSFFYIRGDYDYGSPFPMLLAPSVTIRLIGSWTYTFPLQFIGGLPTSHYALFRAEGFTLVRDHFVYINWTLPNSRWRWYLNEGDNAIEPRGEQVEDEDDLQAYLDWLAAHQADEAASTEADPQQLDLGGRTIVITQPVVIPGGVYVVFRNGTLQGPSVLSPLTSYLSVDPSSRLYLNTICLVNVVIRVNIVVNIYLTGSLTGSVYFYVPDECLYDDFRLLAPWGNYSLTMSDMGCLRLTGTTAWGVDFDDAGYAVLFDIKNLGDANRDGHINVADMQRLIAFLSGIASGTMRADVNRDGRITNADIVELIRMAANNSNQ